MVVSISFNKNGLRSKKSADYVVLGGTEGFFLFAQYKFKNLNQEFLLLIAYAR